MSSPEKLFRVGPGYEARISGKWVPVRVVEVEEDGTVWVCRLSDLEQRRAVARTAEQVRPRV